MWEAVALIGAFIAIEGAFYGAFPRAAKRLAARVSHMDEREMRVAGLAALGLGIVIVWLARG